MTTAARTFLGILAAVTGAACGAPTTVDTTVEALEYGAPIRPMRYMDPGDPNLNPNWDWTVSGPGHTVYYTDSIGVIRSKVLQVPFYTGGHPLNTLEKDMYPADGWVLAYRDFGTSTAAPDLPFFALYNKYRGILRIMIYNSREWVYTKFNLELGFKSVSATGAILTYSNPTRAFRNDYDTSQFENFMVAANSINGWVYGDFMVTGFDPSLSNLAQLRLQVRGMDVSDVVLNSTQFTLSEVLTDANPGAGRNSAVSDLVAAANQGSKYFKSAQEAAKSLRETAGAEGNAGKWWSNILKGVVGTVSNPTALAKVAPIVGGLVGFISSFIGGADDPAPREPLNFEGALDMSGTITLSAPLAAMDFGLKYATGGNPPDYYRPVNNIVWGIFNLNAKPQAYANHEWNCTPNLREIGPASAPPGDCQEYAVAYFTIAPTYVFNSAAGMQLVDVAYAFTFSTQPPTSFSADPVYVQQGRGPIPSGVAVRVKMKATSPTNFFDDDIVFYKVYPYSRTLTP